MSLLRQNFTGPKDPHNSQNGSGRHGGVGDRNKSGEFGTIIEFSSDTLASTVRTERGRVLKGVPCLRASPGEMAPLPIGTEVALSYDWGLPVIVGCLSLPTTNNENTPTHSITDVSGFGGQGLNKATLPEGNYRKPGEPTDLIPGDWAQVGPEGNAVALLGGGASILKSGPLSQVRTHLINDLVEIISRNYRHISDMGEFNITNDDGRINLSFRGASDQRNEAGPDEEHWTIRMDLGAVGDIFNLEFTTSKGQTLFKFHVDASGHCEIYGINGVNIASGSRYSGKHTEEHSGDSQKTVGGSQTVAVGGTETRTIGNTVKETIGGNYESSTNNDWKHVAIRDVSLSAGRTMFVNALGNIIPIGPSASFDFQNGNWEVNVGNPLSIPTTSAFTLTTHNSDITHEVVGPGNITNSAMLGKIAQHSLAHFINTNNIPNSVVLGGLIPTDNVVKWGALIAYLTTLHALFDVHTHTIPSTAVAGIIPVVGVTANPAPFLLSPLAAMFPLFRSNVAGVAS